MGGCLFTQSHADHVIGLQDERSLHIDEGQSVLDTGTCVLKAGGVCSSTGKKAFIEMIAMFYFTRKGSILKLYTENQSEMGTKIHSQNTRAFFHNLSALQTSWQIVSVVRKRAFNSTNDDQVFLQQVVLKVVRASEGELQTKAQT